MISVDEALQRILGHFDALPTEVVGLDQALGRVLAEPVTSRVAHPPQTASAMDGYAVKAADVATVPVSLQVVGEAPAGDAYAGELQSGQAVRIFTGGPLPQGADAIVIQENTKADGDAVIIECSVPDGHYVRPAGLDFAVGSIGVEAGKTLNARDIGLAAAMNHPWLTVRRQPRIAILSTGDELVLPGEPLGTYQQVSSNSFALSAFVAECGGRAVNLGIAPDQEDALATLARGARGADLLVTSGGASVGKHDLVRQALEAQGLELDFWKIAMRPGKPLMFGMLDAVPLMGLPGNPVSSLVCALLFLKPVINRMLGRDPDSAGSETALLGDALPANDQRQDYLRAQLARNAQGQWVATAFSKQDSSMFATLARADCLIVRPPFADPAQAGEVVEVIRLTI